jgi:hypothetical protein
VAVALPVGVLLAVMFAYGHLRTPRFHYQYLGEAVAPTPTAGAARLCPSHSPKPQPTSKEQALAWATPATVPPAIPASPAQTRAALNLAETDPTIRNLTRTNIHLYSATLAHDLSDVVFLDLAVPDDLAGDFTLPWLDTRTCRFRASMMRVAHPQGAEVEVDLQSRRILAISLYNNIAAHDRDDRN